MDRARNAQPKLQDPYDPIQPLSTNWDYKKY